MTPFLPEETEIEGAADATRVARRALILAAVVCRASIDRSAGESGVGALHDRVLEWLTRLGLWADMEPFETELLRAPLGTLKDQEVVRATWYVEGLVILAWALQECEFPFHDLKVDPYAVTDSVWFLSEDADAFLQNATLQGGAKLAACRELLYAVHVRLRDWLRHRKPKDFTGWIESNWLDELGVDAAPLVAGGDLAIDSLPISTAESDRVQECSSILFERQRAILWLLGDYPSYSQTPVDT